ncbi:glyoxalase [Paenibacillus albicereus]|uniref:Glyoxalase n=1 Tax=Paenibacillus albicereus TaxID=2726185 RepID=A0A6H2H2X1_9BACL|nr:glyoxalase [Paenibacillus albicereus]QJC54012.1 glyoxalase [Paenibacillus albicereus]
MAFAYEGIDHVQLAAPAGCEEEARRFYGGQLQWEELPKPPELAKRGGVWFRCGRHEVHIGVQDRFVPACKAHPAFLVTGLEALRQALEEAGTATADDEARQEEGIRRFYANDPFGNRLEFMERTL